MSRHLLMRLRLGKRKFVSDRRCLRGGNDIWFTHPLVSAETEYRSLCLSIHRFHEMTWELLRSRSFFQVGKADIGTHSLQGRVTLQSPKRHWNKIS